MVLWTHSTQRPEQHLIDSAVFAVLIIIIIIINIFSVA